MSTTQTVTPQLEIINAKLWIILVGVNQYQDAQIPDLNYCANDCQKLAEVLSIATQQFQETEIISVYDGGNITPSLSNIVNSIEKFCLAKPKDTVLFYFSGHGYLDNNRPVLCVADTILEDLKKTALQLDFVLNKLNQCEAQRQLVWLDACQEKGESLDNTATQLYNVLEQQTEKSSNFYAMLSCDKQERSWEISELKHGLFTYCIIEGLKGKARNRKGIIDADSLFSYVEERCQKLIEYKKNPTYEQSFSKAIDISNLQTAKVDKPAQKIKRLPKNASQTPQRIVKGGGKWVIGFATPSNQRKALIIDKLSSSLTDIRLCKVLQSKGSFEVEYCFVKDKQQLHLQQRISNYLENEDNETILLYLAGSIQLTDKKDYELVFSPVNRLNLNWLGKQLETSIIKEIIVIADILDTSQTVPSLKEILQPHPDYTPCLITAIASQTHEKQFLQKLITILETAGKSESDLWVNDLIIPLQKWGNKQSELDLKVWLSVSTGIIDVLLSETQRYYDDKFFLDFCPYKSLKAFTQNDAYFFHGREELITEIIEELNFHSFVTVVGASGSGKSSVVRAGVAPRLLTKGLFSTSLQQYQSCQTGVMLPGGNPLSALAQCLAPDNPHFLEDVLHLKTESLVTWLRQQPQSLSILIIDQFEELFHLTPEKERFDFIEFILRVIDQAKDCFKVIITLRVDFLDECLATKELTDAVKQSQVLVPSHRLKDKQYCEIIAQPALKVGFEVEDGLIAILLQQLETGSLPLLQYALEELWQKCRAKGKLTLKDYQSHIGELGTFLGNKAQETYNNLGELEQECVRDIFLRLAFLGNLNDDNKKDTRRRLLKSDLRVGKYQNEYDSILDATLKALVDARLLVVSNEYNSLSLIDSSQGFNNEQKNSLAVAEKTDKSVNQDRVIVEIAHEILLRDWKTLQCWLEENRETYRFIREINQKADEWENNNKVEAFLLTEGLLIKYEEFYIRNSNKFSKKVNQFLQLSINKNNKLKKQEEERKKRELETEVNYLLKASEALLLNNQKLEALILALWAAKKIKKSILKVYTRSKIKVICTLQNIFCQIKEFNRLESHTSRVNSVAFSPDGQFIASASDDSTVKLWSLQGRLIHTLKDHTDKVNSAAFSPDGQFIASASDDSTIKLWSLQGRLIHTLKDHTDKVNSVAFSPDRQFIASASDDYTVKLWNRQGQLIYTLEQNDHNPIQYVLFSPDGQFIAFANKKNRYRYDWIKLWNLQDKSLQTLSGHSVAFSPDGQFIASANNRDRRNHTVELRNRQGQLIRTLKDNTKKINGVAFSPDGQFIASASDDYTVKLWNRQGQLICTLNHENNRVSNIVFSPDSQTLASFSAGRIVYLWNIQGKLLNIFHQTNIVKDVVFSPDGQFIASGGQEKIIRFYKIRNKLIDILEGHTDIIWRVVFINKTQIIVSVSKDKTVKLWNIKGQLLHNLEGHTGSVNYVIISPNSKIIVTAGNDKTIKLWNIKGQLLHNLEGHTDFINYVIISPNGQIIVSASNDKSLKLWSTQGKLLHTIGQQKNRTQDKSKSVPMLKYSVNDDIIQSIVFSTDSQTFASAYRNGTVKLWDIQGELLFTMEGHINIDLVKDSVVFSPDGQTFASAYRNGTIKLWDIQGELLSTMEGHTSSIKKIIFSSDGHIIATASNDQNVKLWNIQGQLISTLKSNVSIVSDIVFSEDSQIIASVGEDKISRNGIIELWNKQGQLLDTIKDNSWDFYTIAFSPDGNTLATVGVGNNAVIKLWSFDLDKVIARGCDWVQDYLTNNPSVSTEERKICDVIGNE